MATRSRFLTEKDYRSGLALQKALFDEPGGVMGFMEEGQRAYIVDELQNLEVRTNAEIPERANMRIGTRSVKNVARSRWVSNARGIKFAERLLISALDQDDVPNKEEVLKVARELFVQLKTSSPSSGKTKNHPWRYRELFRFLVGGTAYESIPVSKDFTVLGITNVSPQAATLENPGWPRPFNKVWRTAQSLARRKKFDVRFTYIRGGSIPMRRDAYFEKLGFQLGDVTPYGVKLVKSDYGRVGFVRYASPVIWIGPYGSMKGKTGKWPRPRHRRARRTIPSRPVSKSR